MDSTNDEINEPLSPETKALVDDIKYVAHEAEPPLDNLMHMLHPWVTFFIMPIFALGNAGIALSGVSMGDIFGNAVIFTICSTDIY